MTLYVFDTSSCRVLRNYYPDRFPTFWENFQDAIKSGHIVSVREVYNELEQQLQDHWLWDWVKKNRELFLTPTAEETAFVAEIFAVPHFRMLVGETQRLKGQPVADPFVIACAKIRGGTVVTEELKKEHAAKIPNVCEHFQVPCTSMEGFLLQNNWRF